MCFFWYEIGIRNPANVDLIVQVNQVSKIYEKYYGFPVKMDLQWCFDSKVSNKNHRKSQCLVSLRFS